MLRQIAGLSVPPGSRGCGGREIDPEPRVTEGCRTKPDGKAAVSNAGLALGQMGPHAEPKKTLALEYLDACPRSPTSYPMQDKLERVANQNGNSG